MNTTALILVLIAASALVWAIWTFNRLVALGNRADNAWSDIDVQLKRRRELIPSLVESVRGYTTHESTTLESATKARASAIAAGTNTPGPQLSRAESELSSAVVNLVAIAESYPDLKADELFTDLSTQLVETEHALQATRRYHNAVVRDLNTLIQSFPSVLIAKLTGRSQRDFFELDDSSERLAPLVSLHPDTTTTPETTR